MPPWSEKHFGNYFSWNWIHMFAYIHITQWPKSRQVSPFEYWRGKFKVPFSANFKNQNCNFQKSTFSTRKKLIFTKFFRENKFVVYWLHSMKQLFSSQDSRGSCLMKDRLLSLAKCIFQRQSNYCFTTQVLPTRFK